MENLKISGVSQGTLKISFMERLTKRGVSRRTLKIRFARFTLAVHFQFFLRKPPNNGGFLEQSLKGSVGRIFQQKVSPKKHFRGKKIKKIENWILLC